MTIPRAAFALALLAALAPVASAALAAPVYADSLRQGETRAYVYDNSPPKGVTCVEQATWYSVSLDYAPGSDVLTLTVPGVGSASGSGAIVSFQGGVCTRFGFTVSGTSVADSATFVVKVESGRLAEPVE